MLQINSLTLTHKKDFRVILKDFSLTLNYGDKAVIIGEEGNGKSTLMKWIYKEELVEDYIEARGCLIARKERIGYLPQEPEEGDKNRTVYEFFSESEYFTDKSPKELASLAKDFKLEPDFFYRNQIIKTLSGGERIKAQLMKILLEEPTVLLLDEPSNDIDIATLEALEKVINDWKYIVLYISHDEVLIENTANKVIHIEQIKRKTEARYTVSKLPYKKYLEERLAGFDRQEKQALNDRRQKKIRDEKYRRIMQSVANSLENCSRQNPSAAKNLKDKMHTVKAMGKRLERESKNMEEMPEYEEAIFFKLGDRNSAIPAGKTVIEYELDKLMSPDGEKILAENIEIKMYGSEKICIVGNNGSGKTTLIKQIAKKLLERRDIRVEYMPQNYEDVLKLDVSPVEYLSKTGDKKELTEIRTYLGSLKYTADEMDHPISELSGGQKAKIILLKMSLSGANVLILDEPSRNFSPLSSPVIRKILRGFPGAIISISHDRKYIAEVCDKVYELGGKGLMDVTESLKVGNY